MSTPLRIVIAGNGIAGIMTAARIRALEPDEKAVSIEIFTREPYEYYSRIRLPEVFASQLGAEDLAIYKQGWYEEKHVRVHKGREVVGIDRQEKKIVTADGAQVPYDELVLCTGADSARPPIGNASLDGVFTVREYADADAVRRSIAQGTRHAAVIGGGLLGLEAARHLACPSVEDVTVIEVAPRLLPRQLDEQGSNLLRSLIEGPDCSIVLGVSVESFIGERRVEGVQLAGGRRIAAETVLISAGITPRTQLAQKAGLAVNRGVVVDEQLRTSDPHIWAGGDLAEFQGVVWGIIPAAMEHAPVIAANILGTGPSIYHQTIPQNTLKVAGITLTSIGIVNIPEPEQSRYSVISKADGGRKRYEKYVIRDGKLAGCILLGSKDNYAFATKRIGTPVSHDEIEGRLWQSPP